MKELARMFKDYSRYKRHVSYVEKRVLELRSKICSEACIYGSVDMYTRDMYLKYNEYLKTLRPEY